MEKWVFERRTRDGGPSGEAVPNAVEAGGWTTPEELLVREAIQNSVDAHRPGAGAVKVSFRLQSRDGGEKETLIDRFSLDPFIERLSAFDDKLPPANVFVKSDNLQEPLHLLYIEDFNTKGLGGGLEDPEKGDFYRLLFLIGEGSKADADDGSGGSFGFGKGVYAHSSNIRMIFVYSVFESTAATNGNWSRLLGCAYLPGHRFDEEWWTGRAWFGTPADSQDGGQSPYPVVDEDASALAADLGFSPRTRGDLGTSILVVGCDSQEGVVSIDRLKSAAETWWWPRVLEGDLEVELIEQGTRHAGLDPVGRPDLAPFIRCRKAILRGHGDDDVKLVPFNRKHRLALGKLALTAVPPEDPAYEALIQDREGSEDRQGKAPVHRSVAYIRRPGMVVTYRAWSIASPISAVGTFQADHDIDRHLKLSEPMEHDRWDSHSRRLDRMEHGHEIVRGVEDGVRRKLRDFLAELRPPAPIPKAGLTWLGRRLGEILMPRTRGPKGVPEGDRGGISIVSERKPHMVVADDGRVSMHATYSIALKDDVDLDQSIVMFSPRLYVLEGDTGTKGDLIALQARKQDGKQSQTAQALDLPVLLKRNERQRLEVRSEPFSSDWAVSIHIEVGQSIAEGA